MKVVHTMEYNINDVTTSLRIQVLHKHPQNRTWKEQYARIQLCSQLYEPAKGVEKIEKKEDDSIELLIWR